MSAEHDTKPESAAWDRESLRDPHVHTDKATRVEAMFDAIAPTYERVNTVASLGRDARWRRRAVAAANVRAGDVVLDVACGTGDMIRVFAAADPPPTKIIGLDFAAKMLAHGQFDGLAAPVHLLRADALRLPLADESVDIISCTFGVRNFQDLSTGLREMHRVMRPAGRVVILEFALPNNRLLRLVYRLYCERIMPHLATLISRDKTRAYRYLPQSVATFERREEFAGLLQDAGFTNVTTRGLNLGGVVLYRAEKEGN